MASDGYGPEITRDLIERFGSLANAHKKASETPGYEEIQQLEHELALIMGGLPVVDMYGRPSPHLAAASVAEIQVRLRDLRLAAILEKGEPKGDPGRPTKEIAENVLLGLLDRGLERARSTGWRRQPTYEAIASEYGLKRTWTTPIVKWAETHQRDARQAISTSKIPRRFSTLVRN